MKEKPGVGKSREEQLLERLRKHPELMERFEAILEITESGSKEGPIPKADDIEDRLVEEVRRIGNASMRQWVEKIEERTAQEFLKEHPQGRISKKKR